MARTVRNPKIDTRSARSRLDSRREPYWTSISAGAALGYRRGAKGGTWVARFRTDAGKQRYEALGAADDAREPNGIDVLSCAQAQGKARSWFDRMAREGAGEPVVGGPYTVADMMRDYLSWFERRRKGVSATRAAIEAHILPALGGIDCSKLARRRVEDWLDALAAEPARLRTKAGKPQRYRDVGDDPEAVRRRRSTANRVWTILRAALNHAHRERRIASDEAWRHVRPFAEADAARVRYLSDDESRRLVNACDAGFRPLVQAALLTGMRYGELTTLRIADFDRDGGTLLVRQSKSGKPRRVHLTDEGRAFFEAVVAGKFGDHLLLPRPDGGAWGRAHQQRPIADACERARITPSAGFHALRHSYASRLVMAGAPLMVVAAQLGHSDTRMVERHYGHLAPSYVADTVRAAFGELGIVEQVNVVGIRSHG